MSESRRWRVSWHLSGGQMISRVVDSHEEPPSALGASLNAWDTKLCSWAGEDFLVHTSEPGTVIAIDIEEVRS